MDNFLKGSREEGGQPPEPACYLSWDLFVRICLHLNYTELIALCDVDPRLFHIILGVSGPTGTNQNKVKESEKIWLSRLHDQLWRAKLAREGIRLSISDQPSSHEQAPPAADLSPKTLFDQRCVTYYVLELSAAPKYAVQEFFLCSSLEEIREVLGDQFRRNRTFLQHLLSPTGLDVILYVGYQDRMVSMTPVYNLLRVQIGSESVLTFNYKNGLEHLSSSYNIVLPGEGENLPWASGLSSLQEQGFSAYRRYIAEAKTCNYEVVQWTPRRQCGNSTGYQGPEGCPLTRDHHYFLGDSEIILNTLCPMGLSVDILSLKIQPTVSNTVQLPQLHPSGISLDSPAPTGPTNQVNVCLLHRTDSLDSVSTATTTPDDSNAHYATADNGAPCYELRRPDSSPSFLKLTLKRGKNVIPRVSSSFAISSVSPPLCLP